jgi:hypothetical protein
VFNPLPEMQEEFDICLENLNSPWSSCHILHDLPQLLPRIVDLLHSFWRNLGLVYHKRRTGFLRKRGLNRRGFLFNDDTWDKNEGDYFRRACDGQKCPSVSPNSSPAGRNSSCKIGIVTEKPKMRKKRLKDSFDSLFSYLHCKN